MSCRNGEHVLDKVTINDLSEATLSNIENNTILKPAEKVAEYESFLKRARKAREAYNVAYGKLIHIADDKLAKWHAIASEHAVNIMSINKIKDPAKLVTNVALAYTGGGGSLEIDDQPWDPHRMVDPAYLRRVAEKLNVAHILE